jgi:CheY-like chemotaxis protein
VANGAAQPEATVLYIEDNLSNLELMKAILRFRPGITLLSAMQGTLGLTLAREHRPDLILLDLNLPDMHGGEVLARLGQDERTRGLPVIVISADATAGQRERTLAGGARAYLTKPLDVQRLLDLLEEVLLRRGAPSEEGQVVAADAVP